MPPARPEAEHDNNRAVQVAPEHYDFERYDDAERWMSYWHQIRAVLAVRPRTVLEIGPGSGVFRSYLRSAGGEVKNPPIDWNPTVDYLARLTKHEATLPSRPMFYVNCAVYVLVHPSL